MGFYIRENKSHGYSVWIEKKNSKERSRKPVPRESYQALGFNHHWNLAEAKAWAKHINRKEQHERRKIAAAAQRVKDSKLVDSIYLPQIWLDQFDEHLQELTLGSEAWLGKLRIHWKTAKKIILELEVSPDKFYESRFKIAAYMLKQRYSVGYIKRLRYILNQWGSFYARKTRTFFELRLPLNFSHSDLELSRVVKV